MDGFRDRRQPADVAALGGGERLTREQFSQEGHIQVSATGTGHATVDATLVAAGLNRRIALRVPNFLGLAAIVESSDLIATVPSRLAEFVVGVARVRSTPVPVAVPEYTVSQHWHERFHKDPRNQWLRHTVANLFLKRSRSRLSNAR